jgi:hypothetical protein
MIIQHEAIIKLVIYWGMTEGSDLFTRPVQVRVSSIASISQSLSAIPRIQCGPFSTLMALDQTMSRSSGYPLSNQNLNETMNGKNSKCKDGDMPVVGQGDYTLIGSSFTLDLTKQQSTGIQKKQTMTFCSAFITAADWT